MKTKENISECPKLRTTEPATKMSAECINSTPTVLAWVVSETAAPDSRLMEVEIPSDSEAGQAKLETMLREARQRENSTQPYFVMVASLLHCLRELPAFAKGVASRGAWGKLLARHGLNRRHYSDYTVALKVWTTLRGKTEVLPAALSQVMPLRKATSEQCVKIWEKAVALAQGRVPTAALVVRARAELGMPPTRRRARRSAHRIEVAKPVAQVGPALLSELEGIAESLHAIRSLKHLVPVTERFDRVLGLVSGKPRVVTQAADGNNTPAQGELFGTVSAA